MILSGLPWKRTEIILSFLTLHPCNVFWTLLLTMMATPSVIFMITGHFSPVFEENVDEKLNEPRQAQQWPVLMLYEIFGRSH